VSHCQARGVELYCPRRGCAYGAVEVEEEIATPDATSNRRNTIVAPHAEFERINLRRAVGLEAQIIAQGIPPGYTDLPQHLGSRRLFPRTLHRTLDRTISSRRLC
jgi:hypothetical protein